MKVLIFGATGLVGHALVASLANKFSLTLAGRSLKKLQQQFGSTYELISNETLFNNTQTELKKFDCVINLAGENIGAKRWTQDQLDKILNSRVTITSCIAKAAAELGPTAAPRIINASAIGIYGLQPTIAKQNTTIYDESSPIPSTPTDELTRIGIAWENALQPAIDNNIPVCRLRFAVILAKQGGALAKLLPSFKFGLGARLGSGQQPFSWVALEDIIRAINFLLDHPEHTGVFNVAAPDTVSQADFAKTLAASLHRPCFMRMPAFVVKALFGQMGEELLLNGQHVNSTALTQAGFEFNYPTLAAALEDILRKD